MATILFGWELGDGLGHVQRLLPVARALAARGHRPVFALCNLVEPWPLLQKEGFPVLCSPTWNSWPHRKDRPFLASSLADVLTVRGWGTVESLLPLVESWRHLLECVQPSLIITDYAPTLCLAAYQSLPVVQVGNWFTMAPVHQPTFPILVPGQPPVMTQEELLAIVQEVQRRRARPVPPALTSVLAAGDRFPTFYPELDPYHNVRTEPIWDPIESPPPLATANPQPCFFAYLTAQNAHAEANLTQMALTGIRGTVYLRNASADLKERLRLQGLTVLEEPAPMGDVLAKFAVIVHHGGGTANSALAAGRPQILFPQHLEQTTTAQAIAQLGVGVFLLNQAAPEAAGRALEQVLGDRRYADNAMECARRLQHRPRRPVLDTLLQRCLERLDGV